MNLDELHYLFSIEGYQGDLKVLRFRGEERLNEAYTFEIEVFSKDGSIDFNILLLKNASLTVKSIINGSNEYTVHGICTMAKYHSSFKGMHRYLFCMGAKLDLLKLNVRSQVFTDKNVIEIMTDVLKENKLYNTIDFVFHLEESSYDKLSYVCQYNESDYNFITRWMEEYGIYFYFDHTSEGKSRMIITDSKHVHRKNLQQRCRLSQESADLKNTRDENLSGFSVTYLPVSASYRSCNYSSTFNNYTINQTSRVHAYNKSEHYHYGGNPDVQNSFKKYTEVEAQRLKCQGKQLKGEGSVLPLVPGFTITLSYHPLEKYNMEYLVTAVKHHAECNAYLAAGLHEGEKLHDTYTNTFEVIPAEEQFRPQRITDKPLYHGITLAKIDGYSESEPFIDQTGRYKVVFPFAHPSLGTNPTTGKNSGWIRMMQPSSSNPNRGFHISLLKGDEVAVIFVDGNPDRPVIAGAISSNQGFVGDIKKYQDVFHTLGGHKMIFDNAPGREHIQFSSPDGKNTITIHKG